MQSYFTIITLIIILVVILCVGFNIITNMDSEIEKANQNQTYCEHNLHSIWDNGTCAIVIEMNNYGILN
jgi:hypothetical protein